MGSFVKIEKCLFNPGLVITIHRHMEREQKSLYLLSIEKADKEIYIIDQFYHNEKRGFFITRNSLEEAVEIYNILQELITKKELFRLSEDRRRIKDIVCYDDDRKPYYYFK